MIIVNGNEKALDNPATVYTWLENSGLNPELVAVEHNGELLRREKFRETVVKDGDVLEVVRFVGGG